MGALMWDLLGSVIRTFLMLRDLFGYVIPGGVLLASLNYAYGLDLAAKNHWPGGPTWLALLLLLVACYIAGHVLAAITFTFYSCIVDPIVQKICGKKIKTAEPSDVLFYSYVYPALFVEHDRRDTLMILRACVGLALLPDFWILSYPLNVLAGIAGVIMFASGYDSLRAVRTYKINTVKAGQEALAHKVPFLTRK
jgi:hypothetical protein